MFSSFFSYPSLFFSFLFLVLGLGFLFWVRRFEVSFPSLSSFFDRGGETSQGLPALTSEAPSPSGFDLALGLWP